MAQQTSKTETYCGWTEADIDEAVRAGYFVPDCVIEYYVTNRSDQKRQMHLTLVSEG